jgi:colicin import membrane protein
LLYFSINWHVKTPSPVAFEMWDKLPDPIVEVIPAPPPPPLPVPVLQKAEILAIPKVIEPAPTPKAEIVFKEKKKKTVTPKVTPIAPVKKETPAVKSAPKPEENTQQQAIEKQRALDQDKLAKTQELDKMLADAKQAAREAERIQERKAKMRAEAGEATNSEVAKYKELIQAKISRNIIMPPDVAEKAEAIFLVTVLPGGSVMDNVKLEKSSGNAAYDSAAERAIYKAQPLPVPQDPELARMFRELRLSVKP